MTATEETSAAMLKKSRQAMCDVLEVAANAHTNNPDVKVESDGDRVQIGPLLTDWKTIDEAVASKAKFEILMAGLFEAIDLMEAKKSKRPRAKAQRVVPGGGARWSPR